MAKNEKPAETAAQATKEIRINGVPVVISQPYAEGQTITAAEARALNQTRAEAIGNNMRKKIKDMLAEDGATVDSVKDTVQAEVTEYDATYQFTDATVGSSAARLDPLTKEARAVAKDYLSGELKKQGGTQKAYDEQHGKGAFLAKVIEAADHPQVIELAKKRLAERESMADIKLD